MCIIKTLKRVKTNYKICKPAVVYKPCKINGKITFYWHYKIICRHMQIRYIQ